MSTKNTKNEKIDATLESFKTMSAKIRYLDSIGMERGDISRKLKIKYQWVRNVLITNVEKPKEIIPIESK